MLDNQGKRLAYIDFLKGIGIALVVLAHVAKQGTLLQTIINCFHMPLFFVLSGLFLKPDELPGRFILKKLRTLILPYLLFYLFGIIWSFLFLTIPEDWKFESLNGPIWFLHDLFIIELVVYFLFHFIKCNWIWFFSLIPGLVSVILYSLDIHFGECQKMMICSLFFLLGMFIKENEKAFKSASKYIYIYNFFGCWNCNCLF